MPPASRSARTRLRPLDLAALRFGIEAVQLDLLLLALREAVHADDDALAGLDPPLVLEGGLLDLALDEALLDRRHGAAELVDSRDQLPRPLLELARSAPR